MLLLQGSGTLGPALIYPGPLLLILQSGVSSGKIMMSESALDGEASNLPNNHDSYKENYSLLPNAHTFPPPNDQSSNDGICEVISPIPEHRKGATECTGCSLSPSKEMPTEDSWMNSTPSLCSTENKKSKFGYQSASSQIHNKNTEDECASLILNCLFCQFYDFLIMLPHTCANQWNRTCGYRCHKYNSDVSHNHHDCNCSCEFDCDHCVQCLLACLFCEMLFLFKSFSDAASCAGFNMYSCCCEDVEDFSLPCCTGCENPEENCMNSICVGICSECCGLCFPS
ncbi:myoD family inhibitor domain-containing protein 2 isoform X2 [Mustelus asterias]